MGGHSHWAGIKHKKAILDAKKGKIFTKIIREITIAAKMGGGDPEGNPRLRKAIEDAKEVNMPQDNIKRAIMKGTGQIPGVVFEEINYEGYGPAGIAVIVEATTDNKNRTFGEIRKIFEDHGGNIGASGCVSWMFENKGFLAVPKTAVSEDELMTLALDAGAQDLSNEPDNENFEIYTAPQDFEKIKKLLEDKKIPIASSELGLIPKNEVKVGEDKAKQVLELMEELESHDDVKNVFSNFDIPAELLEKLMK
ncbi:MAG: YebC/PmpR family DNA-binding transcriptional regulator [Elusimicrobiota bacterium]